MQRLVLCVVCGLSWRYISDEDMGMRLGNWDNGLIKSVLLTSFIAPIYMVVEIGIPDSLDEFFGLSMFSLFFFSVYIVLSIIGWTFLGFPAHWIICKYGHGRLVWYLLVVGLFSLVIYFTLRAEGAVL